jgi:hypothetical protein
LHTGEVDRSERAVRPFAVPAFGVQLVSVALPRPAAFAAGATRQKRATQSPTMRLQRIMRATKPTNVA